MPFKSEKQRRYLFANEPKLAKKWSNMYGKKIIGLGGVGALTSKMIEGGEFPIYEVKHKGNVYRIVKKELIFDMIPEGTEYEVSKQIDKGFYFDYEFLGSFELKKQAMKFIAKQK